MKKIPTQGWRKRWIFLGIPRPCVFTGWVVKEDSRYAAGYPQSRGTPRTFGNLPGLDVSQKRGVLEVHNRCRFKTGEVAEFCFLAFDPNRRLAQADGSTQLSPG